MSDFTASNGIRIRRDGGDISLWTPRGPKYIGAGPVASAIAEYIDYVVADFQNVRDQELGRWRFPADPDLVVYDRGDQLRVMRESDGHSHVFTRQWFREHEKGITLSQLPPEFRAATDAFMAEFSDADDWHAAADGEVWLLRRANAEKAVPYIAVRDTDGQTDMGPRFFRVPPAVKFTPGRFPREFVEGRRLWPEEAS